MVRYLQTPDERLRATTYLRQREVERKQELDLFAQRSGRPTGDNMRDTHSFKSKNIRAIRDRRRVKRMSGPMPLKNGDFNILPAGQDDVAAGFAEWRIHLTGFTGFAAEDIAESRSADQSDSKGNSHGGHDTVKIS